jgi:hypothetical protein
LQAESDIELIADSFDGFDRLISELFPDLPDMHIDGPITYNNIIAPNPREYIFTRKNFSWLGGEQCEQFKLLPWE